MKINRIVGNFLEFLLLCGTIFLLVWVVSKNIATHDYIVLTIFLIAYGTTTFVNLILQTVLFLNTDKTGRSYWFAKTKLFALLLSLTVIIGTLFFVVVYGSFDAFLIFLFFAIAVFVPYIGIVFLLSLFDKFFQWYRIWIRRKRNKKMQYTIIGFIFIIIVVCVAFYTLNRQEKDYWKISYTSNTIEAYNAYIQKYPKGENLENALFRKAILLKTKEAVDFYLETYPFGRFKKPLKIMLDSDSGKFIDERDEKEYKWVKIGEQIWLAENLKYETLESRCYEISKGSHYSKEDFNSEEYCEKYGRLYLWSEAQCACPEGWKLPSNEDWDILSKYTEWIVDGDNRNYLLLQTKNEWEHLEGNNATGFSAIPTKNFIRDFVDSDYSTTWWTSSEREHEHYCILEWTMGEIFFIRSAGKKTAFHSIRCIKEVTSND